MCLDTLHLPVGHQQGGDLVWDGDEPRNDPHPHIVTDEDGSLKIKDLENFIDSKTYLGFAGAVAAAKVNAQRCAA